MNRFDFIYLHLTFKVETTFFASIQQLFLNQLWPASSNNFKKWPKSEKLEPSYAKLIIFDYVRKKFETDSDIYNTN